MNTITFLFEFTKRIHSIPLVLIFIVSVLSSCGEKRDRSEDEQDPIGDAKLGKSASHNAVENWKTGIALYSFHRQPFTTALSMADSADIKFIEGFSFYELGPEFNHGTMGTMNKDGVVKMKQMLNEKEIKMLSMYVAGAENAAEWKNYFEMGKEFEMQYLVSEPPRDQLDMIDSLAGIYNIKMAIHQHSKETSAYWHPDSVLKAIKGRENIGACADLGHWVRSGLDPVISLRYLEGHVFGVHLKDVDEFGNIDAKDVKLGTGVINIKAIVKELKRQKFKGGMMIECEYNLDDNMADVQKALRYVNEFSENEN